MAGTNPRPREGRLNSKDDAMSISNESVLQKSSAQSARSGMALVIVLGLIALLVISSITFAIMMRIERASSANARNTTMARQTAKSALAYAIAAIDQNIGTNRYPHWDKDGTHYNNEQIDRENLVWRCPTQPRLPLDSGGYGASDARTNYFWKDTFGSADHKLVKGQESRRAPARLFTDQMARYLSKGIRHRAYAQYYSTPDNLNKKHPEETRDRIAPEWVPMTGGTNIINMNNVIGRYAFMAFNTSGYLDIPAICADGPDKRRGFGSSASEIVPVSRLFARNNDRKSGKGNENIRITNKPKEDYEEAIKKLKETNRGGNFGTVAEILALNNKGNDPETGELLEYFASGAAYSAFNFSAPDRIPTNVVSASDYNDIFANGRFPFKNKICIGGDGDDEHIKSLKRHKAAIMAGFWMSGLTASSTIFRSKRRDISDAACSDSSCTVCGGKAGAFTLKADKVSEQALWAYLGLIDYADKDDEPAYDDSISFLSVDEQKFARPVTEAVPLFNGFMALISITREEVYEKDKVVQEADPELGLPEIKADVFDGEHVAFTIEVNGKTAFSYQLSDPGAETADGDAASEGSAEGKLGIYMEGGDFDEVWAKYAEKIQSSGGQHFSRVKDGTDVFFKRTESFLDKGAFGFDIPSVTVTNDLPEAIEDPKAISNEDKEKKMIQLPDSIYVCAAGSVKTLAGVTVNRVPGDPGAYESSGAADRQWLTAYYDTTGDDGGVKRAFADEPEETGDEVYSTDEAAVALKRQGDGPDYKIKKRTVNFVIWGEKIDPRFACMYSYSDAGDEDANTLTALSSHCAPDTAMYDRRLSDLGIDATDYLVGLMGSDNHSAFKEFQSKFKDKNKPEFFGEGGEEYFIGYNGGEDPDDWTSGFSAFQREFLTDDSGKNWLQDEFKGVVDSVSWPGEGLKFAGDMGEPFHQMVVRNDGIDTAGELGWLPIGPYATIRLCGYEKESEKFQESETEPELSLYNALPSKRPFHNVLDFFSGRKKPVRGLVNINSTDPIALASVFNGMAVNDEEDSIDGFKSSNMVTVDEKTAESLGRLLAKTWHHVDPDTPVLDNPADDIKLRGRTSMLGWMFDCLDRNGDEFENDEKQAITGFFTTNARREAAIRNSCGLFSTRGVNLSIIVRGEAFTPFFGRSDVRNDLGTTLASRAAYAQIWRDTEPDDDGNYPYFVQFFKIFDE